MGRNYLIDTGILSFFLKGHPRVVRRYSKISEEAPTLSLSVITYYEILRGLKRLSLPHKEHGFRTLADAYRLIPVDDSVCEIAAGLYADLGRRGVPLPDADILIAATALRHGLVLVTNNTRHFSRIQNLALENWAK